MKVNLKFKLVVVVALIISIQACVPDVDPPVTQPLFYHPDGFPATSGQLANNPVNYYGQTIEVNKSLNTQIQIKTDVQEFFKNPGDWSISDMPNVTLPGHLPPIIADNYKDMFSFIRVN